MAIRFIWDKTDSPLDSCRLPIELNRIARCLLAFVLRASNRDGEPAWINSNNILTRTGHEWAQCEQPSNVAPTGHTRAIA